MRAEKSTVADVKAKMTQLAESRSDVGSNKNSERRGISNEGDDDNNNEEATYDEMVKEKEEEIFYGVKKNVRRKEKKERNE